MMDIAVFAIGLFLTVTCLAAALFLPMLFLSLIDEALLEGRLLKALQRKVDAWLD